jgi:putative transposase
MSGELKKRGWTINHKKVYRLMNEHKLLYGGRIRPEPFKQDLIRFRSPGAEKLLQYLSMNNKHVHIHGWRRNVYLLAVMAKRENTECCIPPIFQY